MPEAFRPLSLRGSFPVLILSTARDEVHGACCHPFCPLPPLPDDGVGDEDYHAQIFQDELVNMEGRNKGVIPTEHYDEQ